MPKSNDRKPGRSKTLDDKALDKVSGGVDNIPNRNPPYPQGPKTPPKGPKVPTGPVGDDPVKNPDTPPSPSPF
jgi:hypothetical protein